MRPARFFFSPQPNPAIINNYVNNFYDALCKSVPVVNYNKKPFSRSIDILRYTFDADVMILNWPEDVLHLRYGVFQLFLSFFSLTLFRLKGGTIIWVCHNKESHTKKYTWLRKLSRSFFTKIAQYIIVHSEDAINHLQHVRNKVYFLHHPVYKKSDFKTTSAERPNIDVLIWGNITPYKGLSAFIANYKKFNASFNVLIIGKAHASYYTQLTAEAKGLNIEMKNVLLAEEDLDTYFKRSKIILLPYLNSDTFSSGALIHSLNSDKVVMGPAIGNFIDVSKYGACLTYESNNELFKIIEGLLANPEEYRIKLERLKQGIESYYQSNSWENFIDHILNIVSSAPKRLVKPSLSE